MYLYFCIKTADRKPLLGQSDEPVVVSYLSDLLFDPSLLQQIGKKQTGWIWVVVVSTLKQRIV